MAESEHTAAPRHPLAHLPRKFQVAARDDAMAPRVRRGTNIEFDRTLAPRDGDGVMVRRADGELYFRLYRDAGEGAFEAVALDSSDRHSSFSSTLEPELQVVAVLTGVCARWAPEEGGTALTDPESLRYAVTAWQRAAAEARMFGWAYSRLDCYIHLGATRSMQ